MNRTHLIVFMAILALSLAGCNQKTIPAKPAPVIPTQETPRQTSEQTQQTRETTPPVSEAGSKLVACNTDTDCVPDPSVCHARSCVTKTAAEGMEKVEMCTMLFDYQAAYSAEDCTCNLGKCVNKNLGRTGDAPVQVQ